MTISILDALITQARSAISRAYMIAGLVPALTLSLGWQLYEARSLAALQRDLEPLLTLKSAALPAAALVRVIGVVTLGALFYGGRGLVLRMLQDGPRGALRFVRAVLIELQVKRWWAQRHRQRREERDLMFIEGLVVGNFDLLNTESDAPSPVLARERSVEARRYIEGVAQLGSTGQWKYGLDRGIVVAGLRGFYALAKDQRFSEQQEWQRLYASAETKMAIDRVHAAVDRRLIETTAEAQQQPDMEKRLSPTMLGNKVAALDDYAESRYGIATSTLWTRLWGVLGQSERQEIANAQLRVEMLANMTVVFAAIAVITAAVSIYRAVSIAGTNLVVDVWSVAFASGAIALMIGSYRTTVHTFGGVADGIIRLVDLHRARVLTTFGLAQPATFAEERAMFRELNAFFANGYVVDIEKRPLKTGKP